MYSILNFIRLNTSHCVILSIHVKYLLLQYAAELSRLEVLKKANIAHRILQVKKELMEWWERCYVAEEDVNKCQVRDSRHCIRTFFMVQKLIEVVVQPIV